MKKVCLFLLSYGMTLVASASILTPNAPTAGARSTPNSGVNFTVGGSSITINALGYEALGANGNGSTLASAHWVGIWNNSGTLIASATVPAGTAGGYINGDRYVMLNSALTLTAGASYTIGANCGGDNYYDDQAKPWNGNGITITKNVYDFSTLSAGLRPANDGGGTLGRWVPGNSTLVTYWTGAASTTWDTSAVNWSNGSATTYSEGSVVGFNDDAGANTTVSLSSANVSPGAVLFGNNIRNYTLQGSYGIAGSPAVTLSGGGSVTFENSNSYTGPTTISAGTLVLSGSGRLGGGSYAGVIGGAGTLTINISGTQTLTTAQNNTYNGSTVINGGTLREVVSANVAWQRTSATTINNGGTLMLDATLQNSPGGSWIGFNTLTVNNGGVVNLYSDNATTDGTLPSGSGAISSGTAGSGSIVKTGSGYFSLGWGSVNRISGFSGSIIVNAGTLTIGNDGATGGSGNESLTVNSGAAFAIRSLCTFNVDTISGLGKIDATNTGGTLTVGNNNGSSTFDGVIQNSGGTLRLTKNGSGTLTLTAANTYSGGTTISGGTLSLQGGAGTQTIYSPAVASGAVLSADAASGNNYHAISGNLTLTGGTLGGNANVSDIGKGQWFLGNNTGYKVLVTSGGTSTISGDIRMGGAHEFNVASGNTLLVTGRVGLNEGINWGGISLTGGGTLSLANASTDSSGVGGGTRNRFGGVRFDSTGQTLVFKTSNLDYWEAPGAKGSWGSYAVLFNTGNNILQWAAGNTDDISQNNNIGINDGATATFDTGGNNVTLGTALALGGAKTGAVVKQGNGQLTFSGANRYTGGTTVNGGTLVLAATGWGSSILNGTATVNNTATLKLSGNGNTAVTDTINVNGGGTLTFDNNTAGSMDNAPIVGTINLSSANGSAATVNIGLAGSAVRFAQGGNGTLTSTGAKANAFASNIELVKIGAGYNFAVTANSGNTLNITGNIFDYTGLTGTPVSFNGAGTVVLTGVNTHTGATTVNAGKLLGRTGGSCSGSDFTVASGATVGVNVTSLGGTWACKSLTLNSGTTTAELNYTGAGSPSPDTAPMQVAGNAVNNGTLNVTITGNGFMSGTAYPLIKCSGTLTPGTLGTATMSGGGAGTLSNDGTTIYLNVATGNILTWNDTDGGSGAWDMSTVIWAGPATVYTDNAAVLFNDSSAGTDVMLDVTVNPACVNVNIPTKSYTLSGVGAIAGATPLIKTGAGTLTIATANSYSGGTTLNGGQLNLNHASAIGSGALTIAAGTILDNTGAGAVTLANNNAQYWNGDFAFAGTMSLDMGTGAVVMNASRQVTVNANALTVGGVISGSGFGLTKAGGGTLTLAGNNAYTGATTVNAGTLVNRLTSAAWTQSSSGVTVASGANYKLDFSNQSNLGSPTISTQLKNSSPYTGNGFRTLLANGQFLTAGNSLSLPGTNYGLYMQTDGNLVLYSGPGQSGAIWASGTSGGSAYAIMQSDGNLVVYWSGGARGFSSGGAYSTLVLGANGGFAVAQSPYYAYNNIGANAVTGTMDLYSVNTSAPFNGGVVITAGGITGSGTLNKTGAGKVNFAIFDSSGNNLGATGNNGLNNFNGTLNITAGTLASEQQNGATPVGSGQLRVTISSGATLDLRGGGFQIDTLGGSGAVTSGTGINNPLLIIGASGGSSSFDGLISGSALALTKAGAGTVILAGANSYTGATTVNNGTLSLQGGAGAQTLYSPTIASGALLSADAASGSNVHPISGNLTLTGGTLGGNGNVSDSGNGQYYFVNNSQQVNVSGDVQSTIAAEMHFGGTHVFTVADGAAAVDLLVTGKVSHRHGAEWGGIAKAGAGVMELASSMNGTNSAGATGIYGLGGFELQAGTLIFDGVPGYSALAPASKGNYYLANFTGNSTLKWGVGNTTDVSVNGNLRIGDGVTATLDTGANNVTLATAIVVGGSKTGALAKQGAGTLTLGGVNTYTGATTVNGGKLLGSTGGSCSGSDVTVASGATMGVNVTSLGGTWACKSLTLNSGTTTAEFNYIGAGSPSQDTAPLQVVGNAVNNGTLNVTINGNVFVPGTYPLIKCSGALTPGTLGTVTMSGGGAGTLSNDGTTIYLNVTTGNILTWNDTDGGSGPWDTSTVIWTGPGTVYTEGAAVLFNDNSVGTDVTLDGTVNPSCVNVNTPTKSYTLSGSGTIAGAASLIKAGAGTLTIATVNSYTGGTTVTAGTLIIGGTGKLGNGSYAGAIGLTGASSVFNYNSASAQTLSGVISGSGALSQNGSGMLTLSGGNNYTGTTTVNGGTLSISADNNLGTAPGSAVANQLTLNGGALKITAGVTLNANRGITLGSSGGVVDDTGLNTSTIVTISGKITGSGALALNANGDTSDSGGGVSGNLTLGNTGNDFVGRIDINSGVVAYAGDGAFGDAANVININGGGIVATATGTISHNVTLSGGGDRIFRIYGNQTETITGSITGNGNIRHTDGGHLVLNGNVISSGGTINVVNATGSITFNGASNSIGAFTLGGNGSTLNINVGTMTVNGNAVLSPYGYSYSATANIIGGTLTVTGNITDNRDAYFNVNQSGGDVTVNAIYSNQGGGGTGGYSHYTLTGGRLTVGDIWGGNGGGWSRAVGLHIGGATLRASRNLRIEAATTELTGSGGNAIFDSNGFTMTPNYGLSGAGGLTKINDGTLVLNLANTYSGGTAINAGTITAGHSSALGSGTVTLNGGVLNLGSVTLQISALTGGSTITGGSGTPSLTVNQAGNTTFSGVLQNGGGTVGLTKAGGGVLTFSGIQTYTGATDINGGTLAMSGGSIGGSATITVGGAGVFDVGSAYTLGAQVVQGTGTIAGNATAVAGTVVTPGTGAGVGTLNVTGELTLANNQTNLLFDITSPGVNDVLDTATLTANNSVLQIRVAAGALSNGDYTLIHYSAGAMPVFAGVCSVNSTRQTLTLGTTASTVYLTVSGYAGSTNLLWDGVTSGNWDETSASANWRYSIGSPQASYLNGDAVMFDDSNAGTTTVSIGGNVQPASMTVSNSVRNYTFTGGGSIIGGVGLAKYGAGTLVLANTGGNSYTGGTTINNGVLQLGNGTINGSPTGTYFLSGGGTLYLNYASVAPPVWANITGSGTLELNTAVEGDWAGGPGQNYIALPSGFTGTLVVDYGRVPVNTQTSLGGATGVIIKSGAQLGDWLGGTFPQDFVFAGYGWGEGTYGVAVRGGNSILNGTVTLVGDTALGNVTLNGTLYGGNHYLGIGDSGVQGVTLNGATGVDGALGAIGLNWGTLVIGSTGNIVVNGGISGPGGGGRSGLFVASGGSLTATSFSTSWRVSQFVINGAASLGNLSFSINAGSTMTGSGTLNVTSLRIQNNTGLTDDMVGGTMNVGSGGIVNGGIAGVNTFTLGATTVGATTNWSSSMGMTLNDAATGTTFDTTGGNITLSGALGGGGALKKAGTGILTLSGANTYSGGTAINAGTITAGHSSALGSGTVTLNGGVLNLGSVALQINALSGGSTITGGSGTPSLTVTQNASTTFSGVLQNGGGAVGLGKAGDGVLTLDGINTYTGPTTINGGTLAMGGSGSIGGSATITVGGAGVFDIGSAYTLGAQTLQGTGTIAGNATAVAGTIVTPGTGMVAGTLNITGALTLADNQTNLLFDITSPGVNDVLNTATLTANNSVIQIRSADGTLSNGTYTLIHYSAGATPVFAGVYTVNSTHQRLELGTTAETVYLTVSGDVVNTNLLWNGVSSGNWDETSASDNWRVDTGSPQTGFVDGDAVIFDDSNAGTTTVSIGGNVRPVSMTVSNNAQNYIVTGGGSITGGAGLTKCGTGTLVLANTGGNGYAGGTTIAEGVLQLGNGTVNGSPTGTYSISGGSKLYLNYAAVSAPTWANITGAGTLELNAAASGEWGSGLSASFTGTFQIDKGRFYATSAGVGLGGATKVIVKNGGQFGDWVGGTWPQDFILAGTGWGEGGYETAIRGGDGTTATLDGSVTFTGATALGAANGLQLNGTLNGGGYGLTIGAGNERGSVTLNGATGSALGGIVLSYGVLTIGGSGNIVVNGGISGPGGGGRSGLSVANGGNLTATSFSTAYNVSQFVINGAASLGNVTFSIGTGNTMTGSGTLTVASLTIRNWTSLTDDMVGGTMNVGAGGIINGGTGNNYFYIGATTIGATTNWSSSMGMTLNDAATGTTFDTTGGNITLSGALGGGGALKKAGTGILTLSGANTYSGGTAINAGTITAGHSSALGSGTVTLNGGVLNLGSVALQINTLSGGSTITGGSGTPSLMVGQAASTTFGGVIQDGGGAVGVGKAGDGVLTLSGVNTYTGPTDINSGTLAMSGGNIGGSATITVGAAGVFDIGAAYTLGAQALQGMGTIAGNATTVAGTIVTPGTGAAVGSLNFTGALTLANNQTNLLFDITSPGVNDVLNTATLTANNSVIQIRATDGALSNGTYTLIHYSAGATPVFAGVRPVSSTHQTLQLGTTAGTVYLTISGHVNTNLLWNGVTSGNWDATTGVTNWRVNTGSPQICFANGDAVMFDDSNAGTTTVSIGGNVQPASMTVSNSVRNYTFTGGGSITGGVGLAKYGAGTLVLANTGGNGYTGVTIIGGGTLRLAANNAASSASPVAFNGGTIDGGAYTNSFGALTVNSSCTVTVTTRGKVSFPDSSSEIWNGTISITGELGDRSLRFGTTKYGLTASQLSRIRCNGCFVTLDQDGYVVFRDRGTIFTIR